MISPLTKNVYPSSFSNLGYKSNDILMNFKLNQVFLIPLATININQNELQGVKK